MFTRLVNSSKRTVLNQRFIHQVPALKNQDKYLANGIEGLYSAAGFKASWLEYQKYLTMNLTLLTNGTENELKTPYHILLNTAKQTTEQHTYHFASQAHNNHFVFEQLSDISEARATQPSRYLMGRLSDKGFDTLETFKNTFLSVAELSQGQGWVFLVERADKSFSIVKCNNDGTPYYYGKNQSFDFNSGIDEKTADRYNDLKQVGASGERDFTLPILGINFWDTAYIKDYGVNGKKEYLENVWNAINWNVVNSRIFTL